MEGPVGRRSRGHGPESKRLVSAARLDDASKWAPDGSAGRHRHPSLQRTLVGIQYRPCAALMGRLVTRLLGLGETVLSFAEIHRRLYPRPLGLADRITPRISSTRGNALALGAHRRVEAKEDEKTPSTIQRPRAFAILQVHRGARAPAVPALGPWRVPGRFAPTQCLETALDELGRPVPLSAGETGRRERCDQSGGYERDTFDSPLAECPSIISSETRGLE